MTIPDRPSRQPASSGAQSRAAAWCRAHRTRLIQGAAVAAVALVVGALLAYLQPHTWRYYTDGLSVRRLAKDTEPRPVLWEDARAMPCSTNLPADLTEPFVLADGVTMLFTAGGSTGNANLFQSRWDGREWSSPVPLPAVNSAFNEGGAVVSPDGQYLFFSSDRPGGLGGYDLWVARWDGVTWAWPGNLGYMINSKFDEFGAAVSPFDGRLVFTSDRPDRRLTDEEDRLPVKELRALLKGRDFDLYAADPVPADAAINREIERLQSQLYSLRTGALSDPAVMRKLGGSPETEAAVDRALAWLAKTQNTNGCWTAAGGHPAAATGFALLAFQGRGIKPGDGSQYSGVVSNGLNWLVRNATITGDMRVGGNMYDQGVATLALTEAYGLSKDEKLKEPVQAAVNFIVDAQHEDGGWRYNPKEAGDLSVSSWQIMALKSAELSGLMMSETCLAKARSWLREKMAKGPDKGLYSYTADDAGGQPAMQAAGFFCAQLLGISPNTARARASAKALATHGFNPAQPSIYYWYNAVLGSYQYQGEIWREWNRHLIESYLPAQVRDGEFAGSWDPAGHQQGDSMGRVIVTAMFTLSLEVYYRYTPLYGLGYQPQLRTGGADGLDADLIGKVPLYRRSRPLDKLNSPADEQRPAFTRRGDFVYFASSRKGGSGGFDLYRARMTGPEQSDPANLGPEINSPANETAPALRLGGFQLLFTSDRAGAAAAGAPGLFASTSRYVRAEHIYTQTRGMMDGLRNMRGRLLLIVVALAILLLFVRRCRRIDDDQVLIRAAALGVGEQEPSEKVRTIRRKRGTPLAWTGLVLSLIGLTALILSCLMSLRGTVWCRYTDDVSITRQAVDVSPRPVVWDVPAPLGNAFTGRVDRSALAFSPDGASLLFARGAASNGTENVLASTWDGYTWSAAAPLDGVNSTTNELDAAITRDGARVFFASDRTGGFGGFDLWTAVLRSNVWVCVTNLGPEVNSAADERFPALMPDGARLFFSSDRPTAEPRNFDVYVAALQSRPATAVFPAGTGTVHVAVTELTASAAAPVATLNTKANELVGSLTERGDWLHFASDRKRGRGQFDLFTARVLTGSVDRVANMGPELNTASDELNPAAGMEGFRVAFASNGGDGTRAVSVIASEVVGRWDLSRWYSLGNLIHKLRWWILLFLAALAGIIYLLTHWKDFTSLRAKCILASLLIHLVLLLVTSVWIISEQFIEASSSRKQELSINVDALAQEKLALDIQEEVVELPQAQVSVVAEQADEFLPLPDFKPTQRAVQTVVARSSAESFVAEITPSSGAPTARETPAPKMPDLPDIMAPKLDVALQAENPLITAAEIKEAEVFRPMVNVPQVSTSRVDVVMPGPKPVLTAAGVSDVTRTDRVDRAAGSLIRDTGGSVVRASTGGEVSAGMTELKGPGTQISAQLAGGDGNALSLAFSGKLDVPKGIGKQISPYKLRQEAHENLGYLQGLGGDSATQGSVGKALDWLTRHQEPDGRWDIAKYKGQAGHDVAASGLSLLCYLGWGVKHNEAGQYQPPAAKAVAWLVSQVQTNGSVLGANALDMYDQGIAAIALSEAYALTKDPALRPVVSNMLAFIVKAQHPDSGGWRYQPGQSGDTSVFGWQLMGVMSARMAGLAVPQKTLDGADKWLTSVGGGERGGLYGYEGKSPSYGMAAEGMFCRQIMGVPADDPRMMETAGYLTAQPPNAGQPDLYYWYYGTLAMYQHRGEAWEKWNERLKAVLPPMQATTGDDDGSWAPAGPNSDRMGRVVTTAIATLSLEVYYRYLPFAFTKGGAANEPKP